MSVLDQAVGESLLDERYRLDECVGEGGMARVYRAQDVLLGRTVAIKMMRADADALASPARARVEMTALASLDHPALVKLYDGRVEPGRANYLVMEFVEGTTLAHRLHQGRMPAADVAHVASQLASALQVVHDAGIVHRDLKPSNVLMAPSTVPGRGPLVKLADFGVAYLVDSTRVTAPGMVLGTAAYLAPEQVRGEAAVPAGDIYALGLLLLEALTGERAYPNASGIGAIMARLIDPPAVPEWVGPAWSRLLTRMTATDPVQRPTAAEVAEASADLPGDVRPRPVTVDPAVTQPSMIVRSAGGPPTLALVPAAPVAPATRVAPAAGVAPAARVAPAAHAMPAAPVARWKRTTAILGSAAAVAIAVLGLNLGVWAGAAGGVAESPTTDVRLVTDSPAPATPDAESVTTDPAVVPAGQKQDVAVEQTSNGGGRSAPDDAARQAAKDEQAADKARKDAEAAQRDAEKQQRELEKQQQKESTQKESKKNSGK